MGVSGKDEGENMKYDVAVIRLQKLGGWGDSNPLRWRP